MRTGVFTCVVPGVSTDRGAFIFRVLAVREKKSDSASNSRNFVGGVRRWGDKRAKEICVVRGFRREVAENCGLLGCYAASGCNFPYRHSLRNNPEEGGSRNKEVCWS